MQIAHVFSDLTSLRASEASAARALVSVPCNTAQAPAADSVTSTTSTTLELVSAEESESSVTKQDGPDLDRAYRLLALHRAVKVSYSKSPKAISTHLESADNALSILHDSRNSVRAAALSLGFEKDIPASVLHTTGNRQPGQVRDEDLAISGTNDDEQTAWS